MLITFYVYLNNSELHLKNNATEGCIGNYFCSTYLHHPSMVKCHRTNGKYPIVRVLKIAKIYAFSHHNFSKTTEWIAVRFFLHVHLPSLRISISGFHLKLVKLPHSKGFYNIKITEHCVHLIATILHFDTQFFAFKILLF